MQKNSIDFFVQLPYLDSVVHLGHILTFNLDDKDDIIRVIKDMNHKANFVFCKFHTAKQGSGVIIVDVTTDCYSQEHETIDFCRRISILLPLMVRLDVTCFPDNAAAQCQDTESISLVQLKSDWICRPQLS